MLCNSLIAPKAKVIDGQLRTPTAMRKHYIPEATALFKAFSERHGLTYTQEEAPVEVLWKFPVQSKLSLPITLCLQNNDELNFGVGDFWSWQFPFPNVANEFTRIIDAWVECRARIIRKQRFINLLSATTLEIKNGDTWTAVYKAGGGWWTRKEKVIQNGTGRDLMSR